MTIVSRESSSDVRTRQAYHRDVVRAIGARRPRVLELEDRDSGNPLDQPDTGLVEFLDAAVSFVNTTLWGTLCAPLVVHPMSLKDLRINDAVFGALLMQFAKKAGRPSAVTSAAIAVCGAYSPTCDLSF